MKFDVEVRPTSDKGRGVFALRDFAVGEVIEECPVIVLNDQDYETASKTYLDSYFYEWDPPETGAVILGYGWIYNHSSTANAEYERDIAAQTMTYRAVKPILTGEEITVNYNGEPDNQTPILWGPNGTWTEA